MIKSYNLGHLIVLKMCKTSNHGQIGARTGSGTPIFPFGDVARHFWFVSPFHTSRALRGGGRVVQLRVAYIYDTALYYKISSPHQFSATKRDLI